MKRSEGDWWWPRPTEHQNGSSNAHLFVCQHGLWGSPADVSFLETYLAHNGWLTLNAASNTARCTFDGADVCGDRLAAEVVAHVGRLAAGGVRVTHISFAAYSFGGLIARYAVGKLHATGFFGARGGRQGAEAAGPPGHLGWRIEPVNFLTIASPHLGCWEHPHSMTHLAYNSILPWTLSRTGRQLLLADRWLEPEGLPLLAAMARPDTAFHAGLAAFRKRILLADIRLDRTVPYTTAAIVAANPYAPAPPLAAAAAADAADACGGAAGAAGACAACGCGPPTAFLEATEEEGGEQDVGEVEGDTDSAGGGWINGLGFGSVLNFGLSVVSALGLGPLRPSSSGGGGEEVHGGGTAAAAGAATCACCCHLDDGALTSAAAAAQPAMIPLPISSSYPCIVTPHPAPPRPPPPPSRSASSLLGRRRSSMTPEGHIGHSRQSPCPAARRPPLPPGSTAGAAAAPSRGGRGSGGRASGRGRGGGGGDVSDGAACGSGGGSSSDGGGSVLMRRTNSSPLTTPRDGAAAVSDGGGDGGSPAGGATGTSQPSRLGPRHLMGQQCPGYGGRGGGNSDSVLSNARRGETRGLYTRSAGVHPYPYQSNPHAQYGGSSLSYTGHGAAATARGGAGAAGRGGEGGEALLSDRWRLGLFVSLLPVLLSLWLCMVAWLAGIWIHHYAVLLTVRPDRSWNVRLPPSRRGSEASAAAADAAVAAAEAEAGSREGDAAAEAAEGQKGTPGGASVPDSTGDGHGDAEGGGCSPADEPACELRMRVITHAVLPPPRVLSCGAAAGRGCAAGWPSASRSGAELASVSTATAAPCSVSGEDPSALTPSPPSPPPPPPPSLLVSPPPPPPQQQASFADRPVATESSTAAVAAAPAGAGATSAAELPSPAAAAARLGPAVAAGRAGSAGDAPDREWTEADAGAAPEEAVVRAAVRRAFRSVLAAQESGRSSGGSSGSGGISSSGRPGPWNGASTSAAGDAAPGGAGAPAQEADADAIDASAGNADPVRQLVAAVYDSVRRRHGGAGEATEAEAEAAQAAGVQHVKGPGGDEAAVRALVRSVFRSVVGRAAAAAGAAESSSGSQRAGGGAEATEAEAAEAVRALVASVFASVVRGAGSDVGGSASAAAGARGEREPAAADAGTAPTAEEEEEEAEAAVRALVRRVFAAVQRRHDPAAAAAADAAAAAADAAYRSGPDSDRRGALGGEAAGGSSPAPAAVEAPPPPPLQQRPPRPAALEPGALVSEMVANLNLLEWQKVDVDTRHYHAHAAIVVRSRRRFRSHWHIIEYAVRQLKL